jgi:hypothetical protein
MVRDDTDDFVGNIVYNVLLANERGEHYELPPKLTEDEQLQVAILVSAEEEKRAFPGIEDALTLSVAPPPPPGPPPRRVAESPVCCQYPDTYLNILRFYDTTTVNRYVSSWYLNLGNILLVSRYVLWYF